MRTAIHRKPRRAVRDRTSAKEGTSINQDGELSIIVLSPSTPIKREPRDQAARLVTDCQFAACSQTSYTFVTAPSAHVTRPICRNSFPKRSRLPTAL
jgi:hypothetical protein